MATIPSILVGRVWGTTGTTQADYLQGGTTLAQIGPDVAAITLTTVPADNSAFVGGVTIKFRGQRFCQDLSTAAVMRVKRYNKYSNAWEVVFTGAQYTTNLINTGMYPYSETNGVSGIFMMLVDASTINIFVVKTTDGGNWTTHAAGSQPIAFTTTGAFGRGHMHRNKLVIPGQDAGTNNRWYIIDPVGLTTSIVTGVSDGAVVAGGGISCVPAMATFNNRLFMVFTRTTASTPQAQLYELTGGAWVSIVGLGANSTMTTAGNLLAAGFALLPISSTKLVAVIKTDQGAAIGTRGYDLTPSGLTFTVSDVTTTLIPAALQPGGGAATASQRWTAFVDDVTVPGTPAVFLFLQSNDLEGGTLAYYEYVNSTTTMGPGSTGPASNYVLPYCVNGGGSYVAADGDFDVWLTNQTAILAGVRFSYLSAGLISALSSRLSVRQATAVALPTNTTGGSGVGKTLTATANGILSIDDVVTLVGTRVLVKNEATGANNGIYVVTQVGTGGLPYILTRTTDFDQAAEVYSGGHVRVSGLGTVNANTIWMLTTANPITVDTTSLTFTSISTTGVFWRASCRLVTTAALPAVTASGAGVGKTLTANAVGVLTVDSVATVLDDRIVVRNQAAGADNGVYKVTTEGTAGVAFVLTRATDFDTIGQNEVIPGAYVYVTAGANGSQFWELTTDGQLVIDTTSLAFTSRLPVSWKFFYSTTENTNMTQGTLFGAATGGVSVRNVNQIDQVSPDGLEPWTADWRAGTGGDGLQTGQAIAAFQRLNV